MNTQELKNNLTKIAINKKVTTETPEFIDDLLGEVVEIVLDAVIKSDVPKPWAFWKWIKYGKDCYRNKKVIIEEWQKNNK